MRVLITGVNGYIGSIISKHLMSMGIEVDGLDIQEKTELNLRKYFNINIIEEFSLPEEYDILLHLAGLSVTNVNVDYTYEKIRNINVNGTVNIIRGCNFKKFIFFSSTLVYSREEEIVDESSKIHPNNLYSKTKYEAEKKIEELLPPEKYAIMRLTNVTGRKQKMVSVVPVFFDKALRNEDIIIFVPSNKRMQLLDVEDVKQLMGKVVLQSEKAMGIYNVATRDNKTILDIAKEIVKLTKADSKIICTNNEYEKESLIVSKRVEDTFGWKANKTIENILMERFMEKCSKDNEVCCSSLSK